MSAMAVGETGPPHRQRVEGNVGPGRGLLGRVEIVGVDLAVDLVDFQGHGVGKPGREEPLALGPGCKHLLAADFFGQFGRRSVEGPIDQNHVLQGLGGVRASPGIQEFDERADVVSADHRPEDKTASFRETTGEAAPAVSDPGQPRRFDLSRRVDAGGNPVLEESRRRSVPPGGRVLEEAADLGSSPPGLRGSGGTPSFFLSASCLK